MATHAHSTRTPLLRPSAEAPALLGPGLGRQPGPVTQAIRAMRAADDAVDAGVQTEPSRNQVVKLRPRRSRQPSPIARVLAVMRASHPDRDVLGEIRERLADRIEADLALLDALAGDADFEPSLGSVGGCYSGDVRSQTAWGRGGADDRENAECVDCDGELNRLSLVVVGRRA